ncbi:MAG: Fe-S cluster assembly ATPase SufC [Nitrososphaerales archaeon]
MPSTLVMKDLHVSVESNEILKGLDLTVNQGEIHAVMGPNGSGKSTLAYSIMGHPKYKITKGSITFDGTDILALTPDKRAKLGLFLAFQYPYEIQGVTVFNFLKTAFTSMKSGNGGAKNPKDMTSALEFWNILKEKMALLKFEESFAKRYLNEGFSGGEKKKCEILQLAALSPKIALLDETDSGLDIDALRLVADSVNKLSGPTLGVLLITHYQRILSYVKPDYVHILVDGAIVKSGGQDLAQEVEKKGYAWVSGNDGEGG